MTEIAPGLFLSPVLGRVFHDPHTAAELQLMHREVVEEQIYLRHGVALAPGDTVVDAGANVGMFSIQADRLCGGRGRIVAFEPVPATFAYLERNAEEHGFSGREGVWLRNQGLGPLGGPPRATITRYPHLPSNSTFEPAAKRAELEAFAERQVEALRARYPGGAAFLERLLRAELAEVMRVEAVEVEVRPLAGVLRELGLARVDLLKVDVEGAELDVLAGLDAETWPAVRQVVVETASPARAAEVAEHLRAAGFSRVVIERPPWAVALEVTNDHVYAVR